MFSILPRKLTKGLRVLSTKKTEQQMRIGDRLLRPPSYLPLPLLIAPIKQLPLELLQHILLLTCSPDSDDPDLLDVRLCQATVLSCALVCTVFRRAALGEFRLWSIVVDFERYSVPRLRQLLELSHPAPFSVGHRSAPLVMDALAIDEARGKVMMSMVGLLCSFADRIRELHVDWLFGLSGLAEDVGLEFCKLPLPRLEVLTWCGAGPVDFDRYHKKNPSAERMMFRLQPRAALRRFDVQHSYTMLLQPSPLLNSLTELAFLAAEGCTKGIGSREPRLKVLQLRDLLRSTPKLRFLAVGNMSMLEEGSWLCRPAIELPDLMLVDIRASKCEDAQMLFQLFVSLAVSPRCGLLVSVPRDRRLSPSAPLWGPRIAEMFSSLEGDISMDVVADGEGQCTLGNVAGAQDAFDWRHLGGERVAKYLRSLDGPPIVFSFVGFAPCLSLSGPLAYLGPIAERVKTLRMSTSPLVNKRPVFPARCTVPVFEGFSSVTTLVLNEHAAEFSLEELNSRLARIDTNAFATPHILLPQLKSLVLTSCGYANNAHPFQLVLNFATLRRRVFRPLSSVVFRQSSVPASGILRLRDILSEVIIEASTANDQALLRYCRKV